MRDGKYDTDFHAWANEQAALLRSGQLSAADIENIAEEIESLGKSERRELANRLTVLLKHLLKWAHQPKGRGPSWEATIKVQRNGLIRHMRDNPSLKPLLGPSIDEAHTDAVIEAAQETRLPDAMFPTTCPWSFEQISDPDFWPE